MAFTFDPETAYAGSYRHMPTTKAAKLRVQSAGGTVDPPIYHGFARRRTLSKGDWQRIAGGSLMLDAELVVWDWWPDEPNVPAASLDDVLIVNGVSYVIRGFPNQAHFGPTQTFATFKVAE